MGLELDSRPTQIAGVLPSYRWTTPNWLSPSSKWTSGRENCTSLPSLFLSLRRPSVPRRQFGERRTVRKTVRYGESATHSACSPPCPGWMDEPGEYVRLAAPSVRLSVRAMMIIEGNTIRPSLCFPLDPLSRRVAVELITSRGRGKMSSSSPTSSTPPTSTELEQLQGFTMAKYMEMHWRHRFQYLKARMELQSYLAKVRLCTRIHPTAL